jgi:transcriptional regulator GlxA family with amidase domain
MRMPAADLYFVVLPGTMLMDLAGVAEPFRLAERFGARFRLHFVGPTLLAKTYAGLTLQGVGELPPSLPDGAVVFVSGVPIADDGSMRPSACQVAAWLAGVIRPEVLLCTVCSGAFLAGQCGLLDGRQCTTHHTYTARLSKQFPKARLVENRVFVKDGNIYTSAGISAGVDLALHLLSELAGPLIALEVAKFLVVYIRRTGADSQLSPWIAHRNHLHPKVHQIQDLVIRDPCAEWTVAELARRIHTSPRNLTRLFNTHAGIPPLTYLRKIRTAAAKELVANSDLGMERVAEMTGFASTEQMRRAWKKFEQTRPTDARSTHRKHPLTA